MLQELLLFALVIGFIWQYYLINELKMQIYDINQELAYKSSKPCTSFNVEECKN